MSNSHFSIYCFTDPETGEILYVGSTINPKAREASHRCLKPRLKRANFRILRRVTCGLSVERIEYQIIRRLKKKGQCCLNSDRGLNIDPVRKVRRGRRLESRRQEKHTIGISISPELYARFFKYCGGHSYAKALERLLDIAEGKKSRPEILMYVDYLKKTGKTSE